MIGGLTQNNMLSGTVVKTCVCSVAVIGSFAIYLYFKKQTLSDKRKLKINTSRQTSLRVKIPQDIVGGIIGRGGSRIREIQADTRTRIFFDDDKDDESVRICVIRGKPDDVMLAEAIIRHIISSQPVEESFQMYIPDDAVGRLIGLNGNNIRVIQRDTKTKITLDLTPTMRDSDEVKMRQITIKGTVENITSCVPLIEDSIKEDKDLIGLFEYYTKPVTDSKPEDVPANGNPEKVQSEPVPQECS